MLEVGKLYSCSEYFLLLFPDKETAASELAATAAILAATSASATAAGHWTRKLEKPVSVCDPKTPFLVLNTSDEYVEVLAGDQRGWAICQDWLNIKEIVNEAA